MKRWFSRLERHQVVVHTKDGQSLRGYAVTSDRHCLILTSPELLPSEEGASPIEMPGDAVVLRENVSWVQRPKAGG